MNRLSCIEVAVAVLAGYRLTRIVVEDRIGLRLRVWADVLGYRWRWRNRKFDDEYPGVDWQPWQDNRREGTLWNGHQWEAHYLADENPPALAYLVHCWWCAGLWIAAGSYAAWRIVPPLAAPAAWVLALSAATGIIARFVDA